MSEYIEREALLNRLKTHIKRITPIEESRDMFFHDSGINGAITGAVLEVKNAPAADVAPVVHGKWIYNAKWRGWECSVCGCNVDTLRKFPYCHGCGARMDGE